MLIQSFADKHDTWYWTNLNPKSIRYCRPLRMSEEKEVDGSIKAEFDRIKNGIDNIKEHKFIFN